MGKIIDVPGHGQVDFPDSMNDDDIVAAIRKLPGVTPPAAPAEQSLPSRVMEGINTGVNWLGTGATNAAAGLLGMPRAVADMGSYAGDLVGLNKQVISAALNSNPVTAIGRMLPSGEDFKNLVYKDFGVPEVNTPKSLGGSYVDAARDALMSLPMGPGNMARNALPTFMGAEASHLIADKMPEDSKWTPLLSMGVGALTGVGTGVAQNVAGNVGGAIRNMVPNVERAKMNAIATALERDLTTGPAFQQKHADLGEGALAVEAGGPNMRGMVRGAVAAPGEARSLAENAFKARINQANAATRQAIDDHISNLPPMSTRVATLGTERAAASRPAYAASGVPHRPEMTETMVPGKPVTKKVPVQSGEDDLPLALRTKVSVLEPGEPVLQRSFNAPQFTSPALERELAGGHVKSAIAAARLLPDYKYVPANSMIMIDKAVKNLNGMEREAIRAGNGTRAHDLKGARQDLEAAISAVNPKYKEALAAFSDPSNLIDAAELPPKLFKGNVHPEEISRQFNPLPADQRVEFRGGLADLMRTQAGSKDPSTAAERVWSRGDNAREKIAAVLGADYGHAAEYAPFANKMDKLVNAGKTARDINVGSRSIPMALEAADNAAMSGGAISSLLQGRPGVAATQMTGKFLEGITGRRTEATNKAIAEALLSKDPSTIPGIMAMADKQRLSDAVTKLNRRITVGAGAMSPMVGMADTLRQYNEKRAGGR